MSRRCAVVGHPVAHSLSPLLHRTAYDLLGLDWTYEAHELAEDALPAFVDGLDPSWRGLSLTMPLKRAVLPLLDEADDVARTVGAANTLLLEPDGRRVGANTDVPGLVAALHASGAEVAGSPAVVVGGGATAASALAALAALGCGPVVLRVRDRARAAGTLAVGAAVGLDVRPEPLDAAADDAAVVVSTVPSTVAVEVLPPRLLAHALLVADLRYDAWPSPLLARARAEGVACSTGLDLLARQAVGQVRLMTGGDVAVEPLLAAGEAALVARAAAGRG